MKILSILINLLVIAAAITNMFWPVHHYIVCFVMGVSLGGALENLKREFYD